MLEMLLRSTAEVKVLGVVLFSDGLHLREIARRAGISPAEAKKELGTLVSLGVLRPERKGNLVLFHTDPSCPFFAELKGLYLKTEGVFSQLREGLSGIKGIEFAFVYGSFARGQEKEKSDVDLMVIGNPEMDELHKKIMKVEEKVGREVNYSVYSADEFHRKRTLSGFLREIILEKKVFVAGAENEFERVAGKENDPESRAGPSAGKGMHEGGGKGRGSSKGKP